MVANSVNMQTSLAIKRAELASRQTGSAYKQLNTTNKHAGGVNKLTAEQKVVMG